MNIVRNNLSAVKFCSEGQLSAVILCSEGQHGVIISLLKYTVMKDNNKNGGGIQCYNRVKCSKNIARVVLQERTENNKSLFLNVD